jgi:transcriptional regulator PpsR
VTLRLDLEGVIRGASLANSVSREAVDAWVGRPWVETVGALGGDEIRGMVAAARAHGVSDFRQVTQRFPSGLELPMEYNTVRLGGQTGLIAIGRNLQAVASVQSRVIAAQHAREQDSWKLRAVETRNRLLFEASDDPILLLRVDDFSIVEANPAAIRAGALDAGRDFPAVLAAQDRQAFRAMLARVGEHGRAQGILVHVGEAAAPWLVRASHATEQTDSMFLIRLSPAVKLPAAERDREAVDDLIERLPDGFAVTDRAGMVTRANLAFVDLVQGATAASVVGQPIGRWLSRPGADASVLLASLRRHRVVRNFVTSLQGELGTEADVEISAAGDRDRDPAHIGLLVRDVRSRRAVGSVQDKSFLPENKLLAPLAALTAQIGEVPLLQLVRDTGAVIERHCIETALERAHGNRTVAAGLLGLSRQSLYAKLGRYDMGSNAPD